MSAQFTVYVITLRTAQLRRSDRGGPKIRRLMQLSSELLGSKPRCKSQCPFVKAHGIVFRPLGKGFGQPGSDPLGRMTGNPEVSWNRARNFRNADHTSGSVNERLGLKSSFEADGDISGLPVTGPEPDAAPVASRRFKARSCRDGRGRMPRQSFRRSVLIPRSL